MAAVDLPANYSAETYQPLIQIRKYIHFGVQYKQKSNTLPTHPSFQISKAVLYFWNFPLQP